MQTSNLTARELYESIKNKPPRPRLGFGNKPILINVDPQKAYNALINFLLLMKQIQSKLNILIS